MSAHFLLSGRWVVRHVLAFVVIASCIALAIWQVQRLQDRRAENRRLEAQSQHPVTQLETLLQSLADPREGEYRRVEVRGAYDVGHEVVLRSRSFEERPGNHLLTPLRAGRTAIVVDRGWVPIEIGTPGAPQALPPAGEVGVVGTLLPSEGRDVLGVSDPPPGDVDSLPRIDLDRLQEQLPYEIAPLYLQLQSQEPAGGSLPEVVPLEPLSDGPHFEYALQWSFFALAAIVVYAALIRKELRRRRPEDDASDAAPASA